MLEKAKALRIVSGYTNLCAAYEGRKNHGVPYFPTDIYPQTLDLICEDVMVSSDVNYEHGRSKGQGGG